MSKLYLEKFFENWSKQAQLHGAEWENIKKQLHIYIVNADVEGLLNVIKYLLKQILDITKRLQNIEQKLREIESRLT